jgi:hypothetical protein
VRESVNDDMHCHACAVEGKSEPAVGLCTGCGRAVCLEHSVVRRTPQYRRSTGGIGGPMIRLPVDRSRLLCTDCDAALGAG